MTAPPVEPDAEQAAQIAALRLLGLAGLHTRQALEFPDDLETYRQLAAEQLLEAAMLRHDVARLTARVERLEKRSVGR